MLFFPLSFHVYCNPDKYIFISVFHIHPVQDPILSEMWKQCPDGLTSGQVQKFTLLGVLTPCGVGCHLPSLTGKNLEKCGFCSLLVSSSTWDFHALSEPLAEMIGTFHMGYARGVTTLIAVICLIRSLIRGWRNEKHSEVSVSTETWGESPNTEIIFR